MKRKGHVYTPPKRKLRVVVVNAGNHPEPMHAAAALVSAGWECDYHTATMFSHSHPIMRLARKLKPVLPGISKEIRRRELSRDASRAHIVGLARMYEAAALATRRYRHHNLVAANERRTDELRQRSGRLIEREYRSRRPDMVVAQYTSALEPFKSAPKSFRVLMYPIAHHDWMTHHLNLEAHQNPRWARHLQGHDLSVDRKKLLDDEIRLADLIIVPSTFARETFIESGIDARKVIAVGLGADLTESALVAEEMLDPVPTEKLEVLFAGQINQRKGLSYALDAIESLKDQATLTTVGPIQPKLRDQIRRDYPHVEILPPRSRIDLLRLMRDSDVLLFPSLAEGFGLVGIESMSVGTPVILTNRTFATDVVTDGVDGWLVPACSSDAIVHVLRTLIDDRSVLVHASKNARITANKWDWSRFESKFLSVINETLNGA